LCDEHSQAGGSLLDVDVGAPRLIQGKPAPVWLRATLAALAANPQVTPITRTTAFGSFPHNLVGLSERLTDHLAAPSADAPRERQWQGGGGGGGGAGGARGGA